MAIGKKEAKGKKYLVAFLSMWTLLLRMPKKTKNNIPKINPGDIFDQYLGFKR
jgi:hypothetical protein